MEVGSLFFLLAIIIVVLIVITQPFYHASKSMAETHALPLELDQNHEEYQGVVHSLRELIADFELGKISEADYQMQRANLENEAHGLLMENGKNGVDAAAEAEPDPAIENLIHSRRMNREEQTAGFCPRCGKPVHKSDAFCPSCGEPTQIVL